MSNIHNTAQGTAYANNKYIQYRDLHTALRVSACLQKVKRFYSSVKVYNFSSAHIHLNSTVDTRQNICFIYTTFIGTNATVSCFRVVSLHQFQWELKGNISKRYGVYLNPLKTKERQSESTFLSNVPKYPTQHCFVWKFPGFLSLSFSVVLGRIRVRSIAEMMLTGENRSTQTKNPSQSPFVHLKYHMKWPEVEPSHLEWELGD
jgi:hypothetical protein